MDQSKIDFRNIDEYVASFPANVADILQKMRTLVHETVPEINEKISWQMPTFYKSGIVIQFAAFQKHIGVFPGSEAIEVFKERLTNYKSSKGGFQIPFDKPLPYELLRSIVLYRLAEEEKLALAKAKKLKEKEKEIKISKELTNCEDNEN